MWLNWIQYRYKPLFSFQSKQWTSEFIYHHIYLFSSFQFSELSVILVVIIIFFHIILFSCTCSKSKQYWAKTSSLANKQTFFAIQTIFNFNILYQLEFVAEHVFQVPYSFFANYSANQFSCCEERSSPTTTTTTKNLPLQFGQQINFVVFIFTVHKQKQIPSKNWKKTSYLFCWQATNTNRVKIWNLKLNWKCWIKVEFSEKQKNVFQFDSKEQQTKSCQQKQWW